MWLGSSGRLSRGRYLRVLEVRKVQLGQPSRYETARFRATIPSRHLQSCMILAVCQARSCPAVVQPSNMIPSALRQSPRGVFWVLVISHDPSAPASHIETGREHFPYPWMETGQGKPGD